MDESSETNSKIISDSSIKEQKEDKFGHHTFVQWLLSRIEQAKEPLNIGIFGRWGVGKTGILQMLESEIAARKIKNIHYVYIDCWKLTPKSLREQLLIAIDKKFCGEKEQEIQNRLYNITSTSVNVPSDEKWNKKITRLLKLSKPYLIIAGVTITVGVILDQVFPGNHLLPLVGSIFIIPLIANLSRRIAENSNSIANTVKQVMPPIQSPVEFEKLFTEILKQKKSEEKLVIALDNLDRCESSLVIDTMSIVKSFMEYEDVIYVVPCDDNAIIEHLEHIRKFKPEDARDFLRKFFQVTVYVPPFLTESIIDYTDDLVKENNIPANEEVKYVLSVAAMNNPRRIKQFLNNFTANLELAKAREKTLLKENTITSHPGFLAKILVLRDQFPDFYKKLLSDENILYYIEKHFQNMPVPDADMDEVTTILENNELENFLHLTRQIEVDDILPFIRFGQESREKTLNEYTVVQEKTRFCNVKFISKLLDESDSKSLIVETILETVKNDIKQRRFDFGFNGLVILLSIIPKLEDTEKIDAIEIFGAFTSSSKKILDKIHYFNNRQIFEILSDIPDRYRNTILETYCEILGKLTSFDDELLELIFENKVLMTSLARKKFSQSFTQLYISQNQTAKKIIETHFADKPERIDLLERKILGHVVKQISHEVISDNINHINFYMKIKSRASNTLKDQFLDKLLSILVENHQSIVENSTQFVLTKLMDLEIGDITQSGAEKIISTLTVRYNSTQDHGQKLWILRPMIKFMSLLPPTDLEEFVHGTINGVVGWPMVFLDRVLEEIKESKVNILGFANFQTHLINRMNTEESTIGDFLLAFSENEQRKITIDAIGALIVKGEEPQLSSVLVDVIFNIDKIDSFEDTLATSIIIGAKKVAHSDREKFFNVLILLHPKCSDGIRSEVYDRSLELIKQKEPLATRAISNLKKIWNDVADERKKEILKEIFRIVKSWGNLEKHSMKSIEFIIENESLLSSELMDDVLVFLLDQNRVEIPDRSRRLSLETLLKIPNIKKYAKEIFENINASYTIGKSELEDLTKQIIAKLSMN